MAGDPVIGPKIQERMNTAGVTAAASLRDLIAGSDVILCATSAKYALSIAGEAAQFLREGQLYADLNSGSPKLKRDIAQALEKSGAMFVDAAVMEAVPPHRHKVPISASGTGAYAFESLMKPFGMNITVINEQAGSSSAMKMVRSIFMKGFTALLLETLLAGYKSGIDKEIMASISRSLSGGSMENIANLLVTRTAIHAERRVSEMGEVIQTLEELGLDDAMSRATQAKLQSLVELDLKTYFDHQAPEHFTDVLKAITELSNLK